MLAFGATECIREVHRTLSPLFLLRLWIPAVRQQITTEISNALNALDAPCIELTQQLGCRRLLRQIRWLPILLLQRVMPSFGG